MAENITINEDDSQLIDIKDRARLTQKKLMLDRFCYYPGRVLRQFFMYFFAPPLVWRSLKLLMFSSLVFGAWLVPLVATNLSPLMTIYLLTLLLSASYLVGLGCFLASIILYNRLPLLHKTSYNWGLARACLLPLTGMTFLFLPTFLPYFGAAGVMSLFVALPITVTAFGLSYLRRYPMALMAANGLHLALFGLVILCLLPISLSLSALLALQTCCVGGMFAGVFLDSTYRKLPSCRANLDLLLDTDHTVRYPLYMNQHADAYTGAAAGVVLAALVKKDEPVAPSPPQSESKPESIINTENETATTLLARIEDISFKIIERSQLETDEILKISQQFMQSRWNTAEQINTDLTALNTLMQVITQNLADIGQPDITKLGVVTANINAKTNEIHKDRETIPDQDHVNCAIVALSQSIQSLERQLEPIRPPAAFGAH